MTSISRPDTLRDGLWFVGAQSESGGGVNSVVPAAFKTARHIAETIPSS